MRGHDDRILALRMAILLVVLLLVGYAWSVWSLWRQMHFEETSASPASKTHDGVDAGYAGAHCMVATPHPADQPLARTASNEGLKRPQQTARHRESTRAADRLNVRQEIEASVYRLSNVLDRRRPDAPSGRFKP